MGTVLHPRSNAAFPANIARVSVPFSMGTVLHQLFVTCLPVGYFSFSPLLDGDGVASATSGAGSAPPLLFQSPSRWGRCCIGPNTSAFS